MKKTLITAVLALVMVTVNYGQTGAFATNCPTMEQQQAAYNQSKANGIVVRDTYTQQLQCYYQQLATYWQQKDKDNQQKAKDIQQIAKDKQQIEKEIQLIAWETDLKAREATLVACNVEVYNLKLLIEQLKLLLVNDDCECEVTQRIRDHINHSGGADGTNPGGGGNDDGYLNPHN